MIQKSGKRDVTRFAAVEVQTGEVLEVGMNLAAGESYVASYNQAMFRAGRSVRLVPITWELAGEVSSRAGVGSTLN